MKKILIHTICFTLLWILVVVLVSLLVDGVWLRFNLKHLAKVEAEMKATSAAMKAEAAQWEAWRTNAAAQGRP